MHKKKNWLHRQTLLFWHRGGREVCAHFCFPSSHTKQCYTMWKHFTVVPYVCPKANLAHQEKLCYLISLCQLMSSTASMKCMSSEIIVCPVSIPSPSLSCITPYEEIAHIKDIYSILCSVSIKCGMSVDLRPPWSLYCLHVAVLLMIHKLPRNSNSRHLPENKSCRLTAYIHSLIHVIIVDMMAHLKTSGPNEVAVLFAELFILLWLIHLSHTFIIWTVWHNVVNNHCIL